MILDNIYRGTIIECAKYSTDNIILSNSLKKVYRRRSLEDKIIKCNAILLKANDFYFYDLSDIMTVGDFYKNIDNMSFSKVYFVPQKNGDLYVDITSLKEYQYDESDKKMIR